VTEGGRIIGQESCEPVGLTPTTLLVNAAGLTAGAEYETASPSSRIAASSRSRERGTQRPGNRTGANGGNAGATFQAQPDS